MQRSAAIRRSQIALMATGSGHHQSQLGAIEETITPNKKFGIARNGRSQTYLPELLCAVGLLCDYR
jgi:hypothetical protein